MSRFIDIYDVNYDHAGAIAKLPEGAVKMKVFLKRLAGILADPHWLDDGKLVSINQLMTWEREAFEELKQVREMNKETRHAEQDT